MKNRFAGWPDPLVTNSGQRVASTTQWPRRRAEIAQQLIGALYGVLPAPPTQTRCSLLHRGRAVQPEPADLWTYRVEVNGRHAFGLRLTLAKNAHHAPLILSGDGCWGYATREVIETVVGRGYAFAQFNRTEVLSDVPELGWRQVRCEALRGFEGGAIAAWAWGYQRALDALAQLPEIDATRIAVVGHSRGGKAALLAGAVDARIAITSANNSGTAGASSFLWQTPGAETLAVLLAQFDYWLAPNAARLSQSADALPFDQHFLKALIAPRALLCTEALQDLWANPQGSWLTTLGAQPVFELYDTPKHNEVVFRAGEHAHTLADWITLLDFADAVFGNTDLPDGFNRCPYPDLPRAWPF